MRMGMYGRTRDSISFRTTELKGYSIVRGTTAGRRSGSIRLLYIINGLGAGGAERSLSELLPFYLANAIEPVIVCLNGRRTRGVESAVHGLGCDVRFLSRSGLVARARVLRRIGEEVDAHLIHTTLFESDIAGRLAAAGTGIPVLTSLVNTTYDPVRTRDPNVRRLGLWATRAVDGWTARHLTSHFHAITEAVKESAVQALRVPAERITVIERGRASERLGRPSLERRRAARDRLGIAHDAELVVNVGRREFQKGQKHLLQAASILSATRPRLLVIVCGRDGHSSRELERLHAELGLEDAVRILDHRDDVPDLLAAADIFAFPSVYEGLGGALIEAMALGLPIVASELPAIREVTEHGSNALLVRPECAESLAKALSRILDDRVMACSFGARSLQIFRERFTIERSAERMIDLYRRVAQFHSTAEHSPATTH